MSEPVRMILSDFDWVTVVVCVIFGWWAIRSLIKLWSSAKADLQAAQQRLEDDRATRILRQQESLEGSVRELSNIVSEFKAWVALEFVRRPDHEREIGRLQEAIADHAERCDAALKEHREEFHGRRP